MLWEVMEYGCSVYLQPPPFNHSKILIVDDFYVNLGSANLDPRSLRLNFEFNLEVYDAELRNAPIAALQPHSRALRACDPRASRQSPLRRKNEGRDGKALFALFVGRKRRP